MTRDIAIDAAHTGRKQDSQVARLSDFGSAYNDQLARVYVLSSTSVKLMISGNLLSVEERERIVRDGWLCSAAMIVWSRADRSAMDVQGSTSESVERMDSCLDCADRLEADSCSIRRNIEY